MVDVLRVLPMSLYELVDEWFESDLVRGTLAAGAVAGLLQGPMGGGTAHMLLHHHVGGRSVRPMRRIRGGVGVLSEALANRCRALGVDVRVGAAVDRVLLENGTAVGVLLSDGEEVQAGCVVSGLDPRATFFGLLEPGTLTAEFSRKVDNIRFKGAVGRVHLALSGLPDFASKPGDGPHLGGAISIAPSLEYLERAYDHAKYGRVSERPILDVSIPSVSDPSVAPEGRHLASITMQYAPFERTDGGWDDNERERLGELVVSTLEEYAPGLTSLIDERFVMTPADMATRFGLAEGNIYQGEMTLDQLFFMRPVPGASRYGSPVPGLWQCGSGTHPGGGVTGAPGRNAAREILRGA
jgi:phytoene dehydrogenase-like protein